MTSAAAETGRGAHGRPVLGNVQILRFIAAASVLVLHCAALFMPEDALFLALPWRAGVDLFFVISGFIMAWLSWDRFAEPGYPARFLLRRAIRIVPPYWFFTTLMVATSLFAARAVHHTVVTVPQLLTSYAFIPWPRPSDGRLNPLLSQGWTLNYEIFFYLAFASALLVTRRRGLLALTIVFLALALSGPFVPERWFLLHFYVNPMILDFVAGIVLAGLYRRGVRFRRASSLALAGVGVAALLVQPLLPRIRLLHIAILWLAPTVLAAGLILAREPQRAGAAEAARTGAGSATGRLTRFLRAGGDASYTLYLSHTFTANAVALLCRRVGVASPWAGIPLAAAASIAVAILLYRLAERPLTDSLNRRLAHRDPRPAERVAP